MKRFMKAFLPALMIGALASISAFAQKDKVEKKMVTFPDDTMVNGTLLKAGDYEVKFDEATNQLSILKNGKVKATAPAHMEARADKAKNNALRTRTEGSTAELVAITFHGWTQDVIVGSSAATTGMQ